MATYQELFDVGSHDSTLTNRVVVACIVAAETIRNEAPATDNHANRLVWAAGVFANPAGEAKRMLWAILAANRALTVVQIQAADDTQVQTKVDAAIDLFATG